METCNRTEKWSKSFFKCTLQKLTIVSWFPLTAKSLPTEENLKRYNEIERKMAEIFSVYLLDDGKEKFQKSITYLNELVSHFNGQYDKLTKLHDRLNIKFQIEFESKFSIAYLQITNVLTFLHEEIANQIDLIAKIEATQKYIKEKSGDIESVNRLAVACKDQVERYSSSRNLVGRNRRSTKQEETSKDFLINTIFRLLTDIPLRIFEWIINNNPGIATFIWNNLNHWSFLER